MDKAKSFGNALANKLRGFEDHTNQMESPQNTPPPEPTAEEGSVVVPAASFPDAKEGDTYTVSAVDEQNVTLTKEGGNEPVQSPDIPVG